eukprot:g56006.t1
MIHLATIEYEKISTSFCRMLGLLLLFDGVICLLLGFSNAALRSWVFGLRPASVGHYPCLSCVETTRYPKHRYWQFTWDRAISSNTVLRLELYGGRLLLLGCSKLEPQQRQATMKNYDFLWEEVAPNTFLKINKQSC